MGAKAKQFPKVFFVSQHHGTERNFEEVLLIFRKLSGTTHLSGVEILLEPPGEFFGVSEASRRCPFVGCKIFGKFRRRVLTKKWGNLFVSQKKSWGGPFGVWKNFWNRRNIYTRGGITTFLQTIFLSHSAEKKLVEGTFCCLWILTRAC